MIIFCLLSLGNICRWNRRFQFPRLEITKRIQCNTSLIFLNTLFYHCLKVIISQEA
jgi:hypothetical protein